MMRIKLTTETFIEKSKERYGDKFDYSETEFINTSTRLKMTCPIHGIQEVWPLNHLKTQTGCRLCGRDLASDIFRKSGEQFIDDANKIHNNKFDYSKAVYKGAKEKIEILCPIHHSFWQTPDSHLQGKGCQQCAVIQNADLRKKTQGVIIEEAIKAHGDAYCLDKVKYVDSYTKIIVGCKEHGDFLISPTSLINGHGCKRCASTNSPNRWTRTGWDKFCKSKDCQYPSVYILQLVDECESFIKIGITTDAKIRFNKFPYQISILNDIIGKPIAVWDLEKKLHKVFKKHKYKPLQKFCGETECFNLSILKDPNFQLFLQN